MHGLRRLNGALERARARRGSRRATRATSPRCSGAGSASTSRAPRSLTIAAVGAASLVTPAALARISGARWLLVTLAAAFGAAVAGSSAWRFAAGAPRARWVAAALFAAAGAVAAGVLP